ncbi:hypothetical protein GCM10011332_33620 [Terasakiella brassicae]|uniref:Uncharacterized protein n=1 Tax=Terasakiella brassicae TaxID=1634917 RepID=A0A917CBF9_9PROT|nr:hypothetical protein [Terasakiella brassicae]GGF76927.1 hypothetical protein GCM10011332_33620 [Terasakiella brassicae]
MGQDYPFNHNLAANYAHQFFTDMEPEDVEAFTGALNDICEHGFDCDPELGRIAIFSDEDAAKLMKIEKLDTRYGPSAIKYVPIERTLNHLSYEIRKAYRQFDIQTNYRLRDDEDGIYYLTGRIFISPYDGENADLKSVAEEIVEKFGDRGVSVLRLNDKNTLLDLYVDGH